MPGVGAQGGDAATVVEHGADVDGRGLIVSSSRAVLYASNGDDFADAARAEAKPHSLKPSPCDAVRSPGGGADSSGGS